LDAPGVIGTDLVRIRQILATAVARICSRWPASDREDVVQVALIRVAEILGRGEQNEIRTSSYLWQAAYTAAVDEIRRISRRKEVALEESGGRALEMRTATDPRRLDDSTRIGAGIRDCLKRLVEPRRLAVSLHLYGYKADEAARILGWDLKRVNNLTYRGLADLRRCLTSKGVKP